jgi:O-antigen/teichoic acid export membrane protein
MAALLLTDLALLTIAVRWTKPHLLRPQPRLEVGYLLPYLQFGLAFHSSRILRAVTLNSGQTLVRLVSGEYDQVAYYGLSHRIYTTGSSIIFQLAMAFAPLFATLLLQARKGALRQWVERLLKWLAICGVLIVFGAALLAEDVVPSLLGHAYFPAVANLLAFSLSILALAPGTVGRLLALACEQPRALLISGALNMATFWGLGWPLVARFGSLGACLAVLAGTIVNGAYLTWHMRHAISYSLRAWVLPVGLGALFLPLLLLRATFGTNVALYAAFALGYATVLRRLGIVTSDEIRSAWQAVRDRGEAVTAGGYDEPNQ